MGRTLLLVFKLVFFKVLSMGLVSPFFFLIFFSSKQVLSSCFTLVLLWLPSSSARNAFTRIITWKPVIAQKLSSRWTRWTRQEGVRRFAYASLHNSVLVGQECFPYYMYFIEGWDFSCRAHPRSSHAEFLPWPVSIFLWIYSKASTLASTIKSPQIPRKC